MRGRISRPGKYLLFDLLSARRSMEGMMCQRVISLSAGGLAVLASLFLADDARTQNSPIRPSAEAVASPIGKIVSTTGTVSIEHGNAVVVQANLPAGNAGAKVGDLVYQGDVVSTGADSAIG